VGLAWARNQGLGAALPSFDPLVVLDKVYQPTVWNLAGVADMDGSEWVAPSHQHEESISTREQQWVCSTESLAKHAQEADLFHQVLLYCLK
jgi:hypothetical protein